MINCNECADVLNEEGNCENPDCPSYGTDDRCVDCDGAAFAGDLCLDCSNRRNEPDESMDGDHESALESVYGPMDEGQYDESY
jgi:hypothetical protein